MHRQRGGKTISDYGKAYIKIITEKYGAKYASKIILGPASFGSHGSVIGLVMNDEVVNGFPKFSSFLYVTYNLYVGEGALSAILYFGTDGGVYYMRKIPSTNT